MITGASSGIGYDTAVRLAGEGHRVYGAARRVERMEPLREHGVVPLKMDVTDDASVVAGVAAVIEAEGRIDVLVNNAGFGYFGAVENVSMDEARRQLDVNVFGMARLTQLVLPYMRQQHSGRIINISSIAGRMVFYFGGWYHVSKYAVEALSDALRMEVQPFGIDVVLIEPGGIKTNWGIIAAEHLSASSAGTVYEDAANHEAEILRSLFQRHPFVALRDIQEDHPCRASSQAACALYGRLRFQHQQVLPLRPAHPLVGRPHAKRRQGHPLQGVVTDENVVKNTKKFAYSFNLE